MRVRVLSQTDIRLSGERKALFDGQAYDLPVDIAGVLIRDGKAVSLEPTFQEAPVHEPEWVEAEEGAVEEFTGAVIEEKAVHGPPEDKALTLPRAKRKYRRRG